MRKSLIGSLVFHLVVTLVVFQWVAFNQVKYVPRNVYSVKLVAAGAAQAARVTATPEPPKPAPVEEKKEDEKDDRMPPPPDETRKKQEKKQEKKGEDKVVPSTDVRKTDAKPDSLLTGTGGGVGDVTATGDVSLDGGDFPFAAYVGRMRQKVAAAWTPAGGGGEERKATIYFRVHRDGSVSHVAVEQSSGVSLFDRSCQRAVLEAAPLPPLPREYIGEYLGVHFPFVGQPIE